MKIYFYLIQSPKCINYIYHFCHFYRNIFNVWVNIYSVYYNAFVLILYL